MKKVVQCFINYYRMRVTFGLSNRLLHHIEPFQFVDSPEWYMMQNVSSQDVKASKIQVKL